MKGTRGALSALIQKDKCLKSKSMNERRDDNSEALLASVTSCLGCMCHS